MLSPPRIYCTASVTAQGSTRARMQRADTLRARCEVCSRPLTPVWDDRGHTGFSRLHGRAASDQNNCGQTVVKGLLSLSPPKSPVSNTSARRGTEEESNLRNVAPETNAQAMSPWALSSQNGALSLWGQKVRKRLGKARPAPRLRSRLRSKSRTFLSTEVGNLAPHRSRIGAWCGRGAGLAILRWAQECCLNPALATGLPQPFLRHTQDCPGALPAALAWSRSCQSTAL